MRKILTFVLACAVAAALAAPALAAKPVRERSARTSANAFWYTTETLSQNTYRTTVWYVGVYQTGEGTWSDVYQEVSTSRVSRRGESCTYESRMGFSDLSGQTFAVDAKTLKSAHLDAIYQLYSSFDEEGNPVGEATPVHIVVDWTGTGTASREKSTYTVRTGCATFRWTFSGLFAPAQATGSVDGVDLGQTYDAWLSSGTSSSFERSRC